MAGKTQIGTRAITKKMFGTREITKEVVNGVVVYEKQAPTPSGYSVTIEWRSNENDYCFYSLDNGTTWVDMGAPRRTIQLTGVTQIRFKVDTKIASWGMVRSTQLNFEISAYDGQQISQNFILTQDINDIIAWIRYD